MKVSVKSYWELLSKYLQHRKKQFILLSILLLGSIGLQLMIPQVTRKFIDLAQSDSEYSVLISVAFAFIGVSLLHQLISIGARYVGEIVAWTATNDLRIDLADHCIHLDMAFHNNRSPGELIERIDGDLLTVSQFFSQLVVMVIGSILLLIGILIALAIEDYRIGLVFLAFSVATLAVLIRLRNIAVPADKANREKISELMGYIEERLAGTEDVRSCGAVGFVLNGIYRIHFELLKLWRKAELLHVTIRLIGGIAMALGYGLAFIFGYRFYQQGILSLGGVYLVIHYTEMIARPIRMLTQQFQQLQNISANVQRVNELFAIPGKITDPDNSIGTLPAGVPLKAEFRKVNFAYNEDDPVIRDLSFTLKPGRTLGLLGRTGSGKTTLARLLLRLYDPQSGSIRLNDNNLDSYAVNDVRHKVGMVTQDVQLFQASILDNLTFFDDTCSETEIRELIHELGLGTWLDGLTDGLHTKLETGGKGLSAGQAQLLAFTRIFLQDPGLVVLDEASSRLDPVTEKLIEKMIDKLLENRTAIIIAHRLGTINRADDILIIDEGRIQEWGDRNILLKDPDSRLNQLLKTGMEEVLV